MTKTVQYMGLQLVTHCNWYIIKGMLVRDKVKMMLLIVIGGLD